jgi:LPS-assembly protein
MRSGKRKNKAKRFFLTALLFPFLLFITHIGTAQRGRNQVLTKRDTTLPRLGDTTRLRNTSDSTRKRPSINSKDTTKRDTTYTVIDSLTLKDFSRDSLDAPVSYAAEDSGVLDIPAKTFLLYGKASANYTTMNITAGVIELDNTKQLFRAYGVKDTAGRVVDRPKMVDGDMTTTSDSIAFNTRTKRGLSKSTFTQQGEMFVYAERIKKLTDNSFFASRARFTTCNLDTPHFAFRTRKMKIINNKWGYSGLTYPEFEGVPLPIGIPFGIYPLSRGRHSGLLAPTFTATQYYGLGLEGLGYYKVLNEYFDVTLRTNIYSYGGYMLNLVPTYRKRYRYNGGLNITYQKTQFNFRGDPDYTNTKTYSLAWYHSVDSKARPGTTFSSNVNISSSKFNRLQPTNSIANFTNQLTSSIQYSKQWGNGKYNLQTSAQHSQNNNTATYEISLPNLNFNVNTFYPFKKEERVGAEKWYEKLGISYSANALNRFNFSDTINYRSTRNQSLFQHILDTTQWGVTHNIPLTLSLPSLGPLTVSPSISYQEKWYGQKNLRTWNGSKQKVDTTITRSLFTAREVNMALGFQTALFGTFNVNRGNLVAIRHTIRPTVSLNYKPDLVKKYYYWSQVNADGDSIRFSSFDNSPVGGFSEGQFGGMSFGIIQQLQAKVKDKNDSTGKATKKISLIDNFSITSGYNFFADSNKLSDIAIYIGTTLFDKVNITASTSLTPYQLNKYGQRTAKFSWQSPDGFSLGSFNNASVSINTSLQSKKKEDDKKTQQQPEDDVYYNPDEDLRQQEYIRNHPAEFTDFTIPWTLSMSFSFNLSKVPNANYTGFTTTTNASINLQGDFSLTPKWKLGGTSYLDIRTRKIQQFSMFISRDLHCWQMSINVTPVSLYPSFNISISPKSSILRDLKVNRTKSFQTVL